MINWAFGLLTALLGFLLRTIWSAVKDLQASDKSIIEKLSTFEILVAGSYVKSEDLNKLATAIFAKLDRIEDKLEAKADKDRMP